MKKAQKEKLYIASLHGQRLIRFQIHYKKKVYDNVGSN